MGYANHGDPDYNSKTALGCERDGEPVFILRAKDRYAPEVVRYWAENVGDGPMAEQASRIADEMEAWGREHGTKEPD